MDANGKLCTKSGQKNMASRRVSPMGQVSLCNPTLLHRWQIPKAASQRNFRGESIKSRQSERWRLTAVRLHTAMFSLKILCFIHCLSWNSYFCEALDLLVFKNNGLTAVNTSQMIHRMSTVTGDGHLPCLTP